MSYYRKVLSYEGNAQPVFVTGYRTAFVKSFGVFQNADTLELFSRVVDGLVRRVDLSYDEIDEVICGVVIPQTKNANVARDAVLNIGLPDHIHGYTLNRACTSSLQTITDAARSIATGQAHLILAGGVESLSDVPITYSRDARQFLLKITRARSYADKLAALADFSAKDWIPKPPGLTEPLTGYTMGQHAEMMAKIHEISRFEQDKFALRSHHRAAQAQKEGKFEQEIIPLWPPPKYETSVHEDNIVRADTDLDALAKLKPAFDKKHGTITAGNASALTDGAAVSLICDEQRAKSLGLQPKTRIRDMVFVGVTPYPELLIGPAIAIPLLLKRNKLNIGDIDLFEIHEAFAAQILACLKCMKSAEFNAKHFGDSKAFGEIPDDKLNVNGGAIAIGHPFGATGSRLVTTASLELVRQDKRFAVVAICAAGGMAGAMLLERYDG